MGGGDGVGASLGWLAWGRACRDEVNGGEAAVKLSWLAQRATDARRSGLAVARSPCMGAPPCVTARDGRDRDGLAGSPLQLCFNSTTACISPGSPCLRNTTPVLTFNVSFSFFSFSFSFSISHSHSLCSFTLNLAATPKQLAHLHCIPAQGLCHGTPYLQGLFRNTE